MVYLPVPQVSSFLPARVLWKHCGRREASGAGQVAGLQVGRGLFFTAQDGAHRPP